MYINPNLIVQSQTAFYVTFQNYGKHFEQYKYAPVRGRVNICSEIIVPLSQHQYIIIGEVQDPSFLRKSIYRNSFRPVCSGPAITVENGYHLDSFSFSPLFTDYWLQITDLHHPAISVVLLCALQKCCTDLSNLHILN